MKRELPLPGGDLEYGVLAALWDLGPSSARAVHDRVGQPSGLVYTTIAKVMDRLHAKGLVSRARKGKAFVYRATMDRSIIERARAADAVSGLLGSGPRPAIAALVDAVDAAHPDLLDELARAVAAKRRSRSGS